MKIKHICFECEGEKDHFIPFESGGPTFETCNVCKGEGTLEYDEVQIQYFFPDYVLPKAIESSAITQAQAGGRIGGSYE